MSKALFIKNRQKFASQMLDGSIAVFFAGKARHRSADQTYPFTPNRNFYYLTGIDQQEFVLLIKKRSGRVSETMFILPPDPFMEKWTGRRLRKEEVTEITGIENISFVEHFENHVHNQLGFNGIINLYIDTENYASGDLNPGVVFAQKIRDAHPHVTLHSSNPILNDLRTLKEPEEIEAIKEAIRITNIGLNQIMNNLKPGMNEGQVEAHFEFAIKSNGSKTTSFKTIAAGGKNATVLHYEANNCELKDGDLILLDLGCEADYYCSDISRTYPVNGTFTPRQKAVYEAVLRVNEAMISSAKPGVSWREFNQKARDMLASEAMDLGLINDSSDINKYYYHSIGHYLGLDVHDVGRYDEQDRLLEPGMVITVEPGLYIEAENIGVRIEDNVLITETGSINLSQNIIKTVADIERYMKR